MSIDLNAIKARIEDRKVMGGRSPGIHPTLLSMEADIDALVAEVERLQADTKETK